MPFDPGRHRRRSIRLPTWDYRWRAAYFVTICTHNRECLFEETRFRTVVQEVWRHITMRPRHRCADEFVVMPNHVHGIIWITRPAAVGARHTFYAAGYSAPGQHRIDYQGPLNRRASPLPGSLGAIVGSFKAASARRINEMRRTPGAPVWQRNYYERIVRNDNELEAIREYILDNPRKWAEDPDNPANVDRVRPP